MTPFDPESGQDDPRRFEQWLLDSARADELPRDVGAAWARFGVSLASVGGLAAAGAAARDEHAAGAGVQPAARAAAEAVARGARFVAIKWLLVGLLAGSALTVLGMNRAREWRRFESAPSGSASSNARVALPPVVSASAGASSYALSPLATSVASVASVASVHVLAPPRPPREGTPNRSTLGAQVALLDAARGALARGAFAEALQETARFQRKFPTGELAPEAEVVAIEALGGRGDHQAVAARAQAFLTRYPSDPHAARIKALAER